MTCGMGVKYLTILALHLYLALDVCQIHQIQKWDKHICVITKYAGHTLTRQAQLSC